MQNQDCFILLCTYTNVHHRIHRKINMQVVVNNQDTHHHHPHSSSSSSKEKSTTFHLLCKNHKLYLAPMVLQSELAFRLLCKKCSLFNNLFFSIYLQQNESIFTYNNKFYYKLQVRIMFF